MLGTRLLLVISWITRNVMHAFINPACCFTFRGANTEWKDVNSCTPFLVAAAHGSIEVVKTLEKVNDKNIQLDKLDKNGKSAVYLAAEGNHLILLKVCIISVVAAHKNISSHFFLLILYTNKL